MHSMSGGKTYVRSENIIPGNALHESDLQRNIGVGTVACNQKRRSALVSRINRGYTADESVVDREFVSPSVNIGIHVFDLSKSRSGQVSSLFGGQEGRLFSGRTDPPASRPAPAGRQLSLLLSRESRTAVLDDPSKARQIKSYVNRWKNKPRG